MLILWPEEVIKRRPGALLGRCGCRFESELCNFRVAYLEALRPKPPFNCLITQPALGHKCGMRHFYGLASILLPHLNHNYPAKCFNVVRSLLPLPLQPLLPDVFFGSVHHVLSVA